MKDPVQEFEALNEAVGSVLKKLGNKILNPIKKAISPTVAKQTHAQGIETGDECKAFGTKPNERFYSEVGSPSAQFGNSGRVKNIAPFLETLRISKRYLRCYDLETDKLKIKWLFDGNFDADTIYFQNGKYYFQGKWNSGKFPGKNIAEYVPTSDVQTKANPNPPVPDIQFKIQLPNGKLNPKFLTRKNIPGLIAAGQLKPDTLIWVKGTPNFVQAINDPFLKQWLKTQVSTPMVQTQTQPRTSQAPTAR